MRVPASQPVDVAVGGSADLAGRMRQDPGVGRLLAVTEAEPAAVVAGEDDRVAELRDALRIGVGAARRVTGAAEVAVPGTKLVAPEMRDGGRHMAASERASEEGAPVPRVHAFPARQGRPCRDLEALEVVSEHDVGRPADGVGAVPHRPLVEDLHALHRRERERREIQPRHGAPVDESNPGASPHKRPGAPEDVEAAPGAQELPERRGARECDVLAVDDDDGPRPLRSRDRRRGHQHHRGQHPGSGEAEQSPRPGS